MSRVALDELIFQDTNPATFAVGRKVTVQLRGTDETAPVYSAESGGVELEQPLTTDELGRAVGTDDVLGWVEEGSYDLTVEPVRDGEEAQTIFWEAAKGGSGGKAAPPVAVNFFGEDTAASRIEADHNIWVGTGGEPDHFEEGADLWVDTAGLTGDDIAAALGYVPASVVYVDGLIAASNAVVYKGVKDCSASPKYPAADAGHLYLVSVGGKIGGASGTTVEAGDMFICKTDGSAEGTQAEVGANWNVLQRNETGVVSGPASSVAGRIATFSGTTGKVLQDSGKTHSTDGTLKENSDEKIPTERAIRAYVDSNLAAATRRAAFGGIPVATRTASMAFAGNGGTQLFEATEAKKGETARTLHQLVRTAGGFRLVYENWSKSGEREPANSITVKAGIEIGGVTIPVNFRGQSTATIARGSLVVSDIIPVDGIKGQTFFVRTRVSVAAAGEKWPLDRTTVAADGEGVTAGDTDKSQDTSSIEATSRTVYSPALVLAASPTTPVPVIGGTGDSIISGQMDSPVDLGWLRRALNAEYAHVDMGKGGGTAEQFSAFSSSQGRMQLADLCTHVVVAYGVNDFGAGKTEAQIKGWLETIFQRFSRRGIKVYGVTLLPRTTASTDAYATVGGQTTATYNAERIALNEWLRTLPAPLTGLIDAAAAVESSGGSGKWKALYTSDGIHPLPVGHQAIAAAFNPATLFT
jgi:lysophospholipase L1-like esterase